MEHPRMQGRFRVRMRNLSSNTMVYVNVLVVGISCANYMTKMPLGKYFKSAQGKWTL